MKTDLFTDGFTKSDTVATIGMFGYEEFYFFYLRFAPTKSITALADKITVWFQVGDTASSWQGVTHINTGGALTSSATPIVMNGISATNTDYASGQTNAYGEVSFFYGQLLYNTDLSANPWVTIIKQVTRDE